MGKDTPGPDDGRGLQGGQVPVQVRAPLRRQSRLASLRREVHRLRHDQEYSGKKSPLPDRLMNSIRPK